MDPKLRSCSVFLYPSVEDAQQSRGWGGSGFLVGVEDDVETEMIHLYAVSNDHVIQNCPVIRLPDGDQKLDNFDQNWISHPDGDDLALCYLGLVPSNNNTYVKRELLLTQDVLAAKGIGPGDDCFMVGRFIGLHGEQRSRPVVRFGNLSMLPERIPQTERGYLQESFLVDMRSLSGFSGSPVFVYFATIGVTSVQRSDMKSAFDEEEWRGLMGPTWLLGIDWGHLPLTMPVLDKHSKVLEEGWQLTVNTGMAAVVPAWKLAELIDIVSDSVIL